MLSGVRVVDLGTVITAPLTGMILGDLGADVIKVERPEGDPFRSSHGGSYSPTFVAYNRNKRSVVLDLTIELDRKRLLALINGADVLLDNFRPGVLEKLELTPSNLRANNQRLIHCSITGFGGSGPYKSRPAFDAVGLALSGVSSLFVDPADPQSVGPTISDNVTGMQAAIAVLGALVERNQTGTGRRLEINMLESTMAFAPDAFTGAMTTGTVPHRFSRAANSQSYALRCSDQKLIAIHLSAREQFWHSLVNALGSPELGVDPRFSKHQARARNYPALRDELASRFARKSRSEWIARLVEADVPAAPIYNVLEVIEDSQVRALGSICELEHPTEGVVRGVCFPVLADGSRVRSNSLPPPTLGEHTKEVLAELARDFS